MDTLIDSMQFEIFGIKSYILLLSFLAVTAGFIGKQLISNAFARLTESARLKDTVLQRILFYSIEKPAGWAALIAGIYVATLLLPIPTEPVNIRFFVHALMRSISAILVIWLLMRIYDGLMDIWSEAAEKTETKLDDQLVPIVRSSGKTFLVILGVVLFLQNMGYSVSSLLAGLGLGGMALALASKDTLANLFGSIVLFVDRPFQIGDWVEMGDIEGTVEEVGLRTTRIRTFANSLITVPNATFTTTAINNWSRMKKRRIKMSIGVTYDTPPDTLEKGVREIRRIINEDQKIHNDFYLVNFDNFGPHSLDIFIYCFTVTTSWAEFMQAKQEFMIKIMRAFESLDLEFAFPTQTLHMASMPGEPKAMTKERPS